MWCTTVYTYIPAGSEEVGVLVPDPADGAVAHPLHPAVEQPGLAQDRSYVTGVAHHKLGTRAECGQYSTVQGMERVPGLCGGLVRAAGLRRVVDLVQLQPRPALARYQPCTQQLSWLGGGKRFIPGW